MSGALTFIICASIALQGVFGEYEYESSEVDESAPVYYDPDSEGVSSQDVTVTPFARGKAVIGLAFADELYIVREKSSVVELYSSETLESARNLTVDGLTDPADIVVSNDCKLLYVANSDERLQEPSASTNKIFAVGLTGESTSWPLDCTPHGLSIANDGCNVVVACNAEGNSKLIEFEQDGTLVRTVRVPEVDGASTVKDCVDLSGDRFVVSFFDAPAPGEKSPVCLIQLATSQEDSGLSSEAVFDGTVTECFTGPESEWQQLPYPKRLAVDNDGSILVADYYTGIVIKLDSSLNLVKQLIMKENIGNWAPTGLALDEANSRIYLSLENRNEDGEVLRCQLN